MNRMQLNIESMKILKTILLCIIALLPPVAKGHIGQKNIIQQAIIGIYPARITIKKPSVIPGVARIFIRFEEDFELESVSVQPLQWSSGREGSPPPDLAVPVKGEPGLYESELWIMTGSAYSINISAKGQEGEGSAYVPYSSIATNTPTMSLPVQILLFGFLIFLVVFLLAIVRQTVAFSTLTKDSTPSKGRIVSANIVTFLFTGIIGYALFFGKQWWDEEEDNYKNNRLFKPVQTTSDIYLVNKPQGRLGLRIQAPGDRLYRNGPIISDHGKIMHAFIVNKHSDSSKIYAAHLHPSKFNREVFWSFFDSVIPQGDYHLFADISQETGFSQTLLGTITIGQCYKSLDELGEVEEAWVRKNFESIDLDDSFFESKAPETSPSKAIWRNPEFSLEWTGKNTSDPSEQLTFQLRDSAGQPMNPELYLGMSAHAVVVNKDGTVYTHLHPSGNISMAAAQLAELRDTGKAPRKTGITEPICELPSVDESIPTWSKLNASSQTGEIVFPYLPPDGDVYRTFVQFKIGGSVKTAYFELTLRE